MTRQYKDAYGRSSTKGLAVSQAVETQVALPRHGHGEHMRDCDARRKTLGATIHLVEEAKDLAGDVLPASLLVVHDTGGGGEHDVAERTSREELADPLLDLAERDVEARGDDTALVEAAVELDDDLAGAVVIDLLELADVA